jgi:hypothetical protein
MIPLGGYRKALDTVSGRAYLPTTVWNRRLTTKQLQRRALSKHMGSTTFGKANPATMIGFAMLQDIKINRDGCGRVRVVGRA